jgi:hypothetical protein
MSNRDEFPESVKRAVAARASWHCSLTGCAKPTVGPSEESPDGVIMIGKAAHISGAAPGKGSRRYDPSMSPEERRSITNAIWLCAYHADVIDRDEVTYTIEKLHAMKAEHETRWGEMVRSGRGHDLGAGLLAVGPQVVCSGEIQQVAAESWTLRLKHFLEGDVHDVVSFIDGFTTAAVPNRYVLSNELGDGRVLAAAPTLIKQDGGYALQCPIARGFPRIRAQDIGSNFALHPETRDLYVDKKGSIARVSGIERLRQHVEMVLSLQQGESPFYPDVGIRFFEYFEAYRGSPWLSLLMMLDVVREASIPFTDVVSKKQYTQLRCVKRVHGFELLSEVPTNHRLPVRVDFDVNGLGRWQRELAIYMPTREQMDRQAKLRVEMAPVFTEFPPPGITPGKVKL